MNNPRNNPSDLFYSNQHLWVRVLPDGEMESGITDYAQDLLGDIVYVQAPKVGESLTEGMPCGLVESVKTGSDLHAPLSGIVTAVNSALEGTPELINDKTYQTWIFKFKPLDAESVHSLLSAEAYTALVSQ